MYNQCKLMRYEPGPPLIDNQYGYTYVIEVEYKDTTLFYCGSKKYKGLYHPTYNGSSQVDFVIEILKSNPSIMTIMNRFTDKRSMLNAESKLIKYYKSKYGVFHFDSGRCINYNEGSGGGIEYLDEDRKAETYEKSVATRQKHFREDPNSVPQWLPRYGEKNPFYGKTHSDDTKRKLSLIATKIFSGRKWITKDGECKFLKADEIETYLNDGWVLGRSSKAKESIKAGTNDGLSRPHKNRTKYYYITDNGNIVENYPNIVARFHKTWKKVENN